LPVLGFLVDDLGVIATVRTDTSGMKPRLVTVSSSTDTSGNSLSFAVSTCHATGRPVMVQTAA
jgi:hypothetical protein